MKKLIALLMALCLLLSAGAALADVTYPIKTDKPVKLKVWMEMNAGASQVFTNYMENPVYQRFSEVTGIELEMMHPTYGAAGEGFGMMLAGSELPDIIVDLEKFYNGGAVAAYDDELIYDLTPYLEENAPDYYKLINVNDDVRRQFYNEDGQVLGFYYYEDEYDSLADCLVVRPDWCEEFGIDPAQITTFDKLEEYLQKVKDTKPGVTPFLTSKDKTFTTLGAGYNVYQGFYQEDGTVKYYADSQEWHDFLARMHSWYVKGYMGTDFGTIGNAQIRKLYSAGTVGCLVVPIGNAYSDSKASGTPIAKTPFQSYSEDAKIHVYNLGVNVNTGYCTVVTTACDEKLLPIVCQFLNYTYTDEGSVFANRGPEGLSWVATDDQGGFKFTDWVIHNELYETSIMHNVCRMTYWPCKRIPDTQCSPNLLRDETAVALRLQYADRENWDNAWLMPTSVTLTTDENNERLKIMSNVDTYVSEMSLKFIRGEADLETGWDAYVQQLAAYKLSRAVEITQGAYDRYLSR